MNCFNEYKKKALEREFPLNPQQQQAVFQTEGPLLILAGAGSGKTTVLINRIAYLLKYGRAYETNWMDEDISPEDMVFMEEYAQTGKGDPDYFTRLVAVEPPPPWSILAITFTNKAANELKERLARAVGPESESIWACTFHAACLRILRRDIEKAGRGKNCAIYDADDSLRLVRDIIKSQNLDDKRFEPKGVRNAISKAKDSMLSPRDYRASAGSDYYKTTVADIYEAYEKTLAELNAIDFDDILLLTVRMLEQYPEVLEYYQRRFRYILIDEYQDTNRVQYKLVSMLAAKHQNLCVVGDDDQSIYRFRGATIENILSFETQYPDAKIIRLEQNYRSTGNILDAANAVIAKNTARKGKTLWTENERGAKITQYQALDESSEAAFIGRTILDRVKKGAKFSSHAVLYRINAMAGEIEKQFVRSGIPYRIVGGARFFDHKEIKDVMAYLSLIYNPADNLRLLRIINEPKRGIGDATITAMQRISEELGIPLLHVAARADEFAALSKKSATLLEFARMILDFSEQVGSIPLAELFGLIIEQSGYLAMLKAGGRAEEGRIENVYELLSMIKKYEETTPQPSLEGFLEETALMTDLDNYDQNADAVVLMTIHAAKGLEFDTVFVAGAEENIFPSNRSIYEPAELEEERRLAYVAFTRAKKLLYITHAENRMLFGNTTRNRLSRFVSDIPAELKEVKGARENTPRPAAAGMTAVPSRQRPEPVKTAQPFSRPVPKSTPTAERYMPGDQVFHDTFGRGIVTSAKPMGADFLLEIAFDNCGTKRIMANYARLKRE